MKPVPWIVLATCLMTHTAAAARQLDFAPLEAELAQRAAEERFAGVVAIARGGELLHLSAHGQASIELGVPHSAETRFKLHSLSKPILATLLLRSVDAGHIGLDDLVGEHLPQCPGTWSEVTVRHLATHTSGIPDVAGDFLSDWQGSALATWEALAPDLAERATDFEPGAGWAYSNAGYVLLAALLEARWERPLATLFEEQLFGPAKLHAMSLEVTPPWDSISYDGHRVMPGLAAGHNGAPGALQVASSKMYAIPGAGGIVSDAGSLVDFAHALFEGDLLTPDTRLAMTQVAPGQSVPYALGWIVRERAGQPVYVHDGGNNGFVTSLEYYPELRLTVVVLCNLGYVAMGPLRDTVAELALAALE